MVNLVKADLINQLELKYWRNGFINTRYAVVEFCMGYYGSVSPIVMDAIDSLYADGFIKA